MRNKKRKKLRDKVNKMQKTPTKRRKRINTELLTGYQIQQIQHRGRARYKK